MSRGRLVDAVWIKQRMAAKDARMAREQAARQKKAAPTGEPDWSKTCENCGQTPVVSGTTLCGPCCFGEADTAGGNW